MEISEQEILRRRDMRGVLTFTIDPADAKDFDDALSFAAQEDGTWQVGVHIADVSHYVAFDSDIDRDAYERGTSIYYVDHVDPMLPERLCNDLCSLRPGEDKLCMSVVFAVAPDARVLKYKICRTVIRSDARLSYEQAQQLLDSPDGTPLSDALTVINGLARQMRKARFAAGAMELEQEEVRFVLDKNGHPVDILFHKPTDANHLIEEWMLLTNRTVATHLRDRLMVFRVHDKPDPGKLADLEDFRRHMGKRIQPQVLELLTIRAMAKAVYSTRNIGHYGLAFPYYTHFTSPIRRYPDLMVHRLVERYLLGGKRPVPERRDLEEACRHCSEMEQYAQAEERASVKMFQALWISDHVGEEFDGHICGVTEFGLFVQLDDNHCVGLIHSSQVVPGDYLKFDEKNYRLIAAGSGRTFTLGDPIRVCVVRADVEKRQIDFIPVE